MHGYALQLKGSLQVLTLMFSEHYLLAYFGTSVIHFNGPAETGQLQLSTLVMNSSDLFKFPVAFNFQSDSALG